MYYRNDPAPGRGIAAVLRRELSDKLGHRERQILEAPDVQVCRWDGSSDCLEFSAGGQSFVVSRNREIVG